eukprot:7671-Chlamydomonas_euryale.AAC.10
MRQSDPTAGSPSSLLLHDLLLLRQLPACNAFPLLLCNVQRVILQSTACTSLECRKQVMHKGTDRVEDAKTVKLPAVQ